MPNSGNVNGKDVSSFENSCVVENEKRSPNSLLELDDKESDVKINKHHSSGIFQLMLKIVCNTNFG
jgi:hypothetical protein